MLSPKKMKYRKWHRLRGGLSGVATSGDLIAFGSYGLKAITAGEVSARQIEAARKAINRYIKRGGKVWIRIFPHKPVTLKAAEVPMGSGKGMVDKYVAAILPGKIIFEMAGISETEAKEALRLASHKLSVQTRFLVKGQY